MEGLHEFVQFGGWVALTVAGYWIYKELKNPDYMDQHDNFITKEEFYHPKNTTMETTVVDVDAKGYHNERIECPQCGSTQQAKVNHTGWNSYVHQCSSCKYVIGESEWNRVDTI
jgi:ribosomal protein L37AE/L43A